MPQRTKRQKQLENNKYGGTKMIQCKDNWSPARKRNCVQRYNEDNFTERRMNRGCN